MLFAWEESALAGFWFLGPQGPFVLFWLMVVEGITEAMQQGKTWVNPLAALSFAALLASPAIAAADGPPLSGHFGEAYQVYDEPHPAPDTVFEARDGESVTMADFEGRVLVVNFWATWCAPCVEEMPTLDALDMEISPKGADVIAVSQDRGGREQVEPFLRDRLNLQQLGIYLDQKGELARAFDVRGLPATFVIDAEGQVVGRLDGPAEWNDPEVHELVEYYIEQAEAGS